MDAFMKTVTLVFVTIVVIGSVTRFAVYPMLLKYISEIGRYID